MASFLSDFSNKSLHAALLFPTLAICTSLLTPWCRVLLEKLTGLQLVKKFPAFHGTRRFITALKSVRQLSLSWASPIQCICPHPTSCRSILILSTHLSLGHSSGLFPSGFPTKTLYLNAIRCGVPVMKITFIYHNVSLQILPNTSFNIRFFFIIHKFHTNIIQQEQLKHFILLLNNCKAKILDRNSADLASERSSSRSLRRK